MKQEKAQHDQCVGHGLQGWCLLSAARLDRFEKTNEMLLNFNNLSSARLQQMSERFLHHTRTLVEMKRDLDSIFRRIRWVLDLSSFCLPLGLLPFSVRITHPA